MQIRPSSGGALNKNQRMQTNDDVVSVESSRIYSWEPSLQEINQN